MNIFNLKNHFYRNNKKKLSSPYKKIISTAITLTAFLAVILPSAAQAETEDEWGYRVLGIQNSIDNYAPLSMTTWPGTHNAYSNDNDDNIEADRRNQPDSITTQLNRGVREMSIDVHWDGALRMCHNNFTPFSSAVWTWCVDGHSGDRFFTHGLRDLKHWMNDNPGQVLLVKLDIVSDATLNHHIPMKKKVKRKIKKILSDYVYTTDLIGPDDTYAHIDCSSESGASSRATHLPVSTLSKADVLAAGKNIIFYTSEECNYGNKEIDKYLFYLPKNELMMQASTPDDVANDNVTMSRTSDGAVRGNGDGVCPPEWDDCNDVKMVPGAGSVAQHSNHADHAGVEAFMDAGLNIIETYGLNANEGNDNRAWEWEKEGHEPIQSKDLVWSWGSEGRHPNINSGKTCAYLEQTYAGADVDRFVIGSSCDNEKYYACYDPNQANESNRWKISTNTESFYDIDKSKNDCSTVGAGYRFGVPTRKYDLNLLLAARADAGRDGQHIWLNYRLKDDEWITTDSSSGAFDMRWLPLASDYDTSATGRKCTQMKPNGYFINDSVSNYNDCTGAGETLPDARAFCYNTNSKEFNITSNKYSFVDATFACAQEFKDQYSLFFTPRSWWQHQILVDLIADNSITDNIWMGYRQEASGDRYLIYFTDDFQAIGYSEGDTSGAQLPLADKWENDGPVFNYKCSWQENNGIFHSDTIGSFACSVVKRYLACQKIDREGSHWKLSPDTGFWSSSRCRDLGADWRFSAPTTEDDYELLLEAQSDIYTIWINVRHVDKGYFTALGVAEHQFLAEMGNDGNWASGEPSDANSACAGIAANSTDFTSIGSCDDTHYAACQKIDRYENSSWKITYGAGEKTSFDDSNQRCQSQFGGEYTFAVPTTEADLDAFEIARAAVNKTADPLIWVNYALVGDDGDEIDDWEATEGYYGSFLNRNEPQNGFWYSSPYYNTAKYCAYIKSGNHKKIENGYNCSSMVNSSLCRKVLPSGDSELTYTSTKVSIDNAATQCGEEFGREYEFATVETRDEAIFIKDLRDSNNQDNRKIWLNYTRQDNDPDNDGWNETWKADAGYHMEYMKHEWGNNDPEANDICGSTGTQYALFMQSSCSNTKYAACRAIGPWGASMWKFTTAQVSWEDANSTCASEFGDNYQFVMPFTKKDFDNMFKRRDAIKGNVQVWLNYQREGNGYFITDPGMLLGGNWASGQPDNQTWTTYDQDAAKIDIGTTEMIDAYTYGTFYAACYNADREDEYNQWRFTSTEVTFDDAASQCSTEFPGYSFRVPTTPEQMVWFQKVREDAGKDDEYIWVNYTDAAIENIWVPNDNGQ